MRWFQSSVPLLLVGAVVAIARVEPLRRALLPPEPAEEVKLRQVIPELRIDADSLSAALEQLGQQAGSRIRFRPEAFKDPSGAYAIDPAKARIALHFQNITFGEALDGLLAPFVSGGADYRVDGDAIVVLPAAGKAHQVDVLRAYNVRDLLPPGDELVVRHKDRALYEFGPRREIILGRAGDLAQCMAVELWASGGQPEAMAVGNFVIVRGTPAVQRRARRLIGEMRLVQRDEGQSH